MDIASSNLEELIKLEKGEMTLGTWWKSKESTQKYQEQMTKNKDKWQSDVVNSRLHY